MKTMFFARKSVWGAALVCSLFLLALSSVNGGEPIAVQAGNSGEPIAVQANYWVGIQVAPVPEALVPHFSENGELIYVDAVVPKSPAEKAKLRRGDVLLQLGEKKIGAFSDFVNEVNRAKDTELNLVFMRKGKKEEAKITPALRPENMKMPAPAFPRGEFKFNLDGKSQDEMLKKMIQQMQEQILQMQDSESQDFAPDEPVLSRVLIKGDVVDRLEVSEEKDGDGKTVFSVKHIVSSNGKKNENAWKVTDLKDLPEEIRAEVKSMLEK